MYDTVRTPEATGFDRTTEIPHDSPAELLTDKQRRKIEKQTERYRNRRARLPVIIGGTAITLSSLSFAYWQDVSANEALSAQSQPRIETILAEQPTEFGTISSTFYLAGFDTKDGDVFAEKVGVSIQQIIPGSAESIDYGDAPLDPKEIAKKIIAVAEADKLATISLSGNSLGGIVAAEVAHYIISNSDIEIEAIILNSTPDGSKGLLPNTKGNLATMMDWLKIVPGGKHSTAVRYAATMAQGVDRYTQGDSLPENIDDFIRVSNETIGLINEDRRPGMWLIVDQALAITNSNLESIITSIGEQREDKRMPVIIYMRPSDKHDDTVVDVQASSKNICGYAYNADLNCVIVFVEGARHTSYQFNQEAYDAGLMLRQLVIQENIQSEAISYAMRQQSAFQQGIFDVKDSDD